MRWADGKIKNITKMGFSTYMGFSGLEVRRLIHLPEAI
jgi:hypothetical protein